MRKSFLRISPYPYLHFSPIVSRTVYRKSISIECVERFNPDKSSLSLFRKLLTIVVAGYFLGEISSKSSTIIRRQITWGVRETLSPGWTIYAVYRIPFE